MNTGATENQKRKLRNPFSPLTILADLVVAIVVFTLVFMENVTAVHIIIGVVIMIVFQVISFIPTFLFLRSEKKSGNI